METKDVLNDCLRCHKVGYETNSTHWHYCNDCVKTCSICKELKVLWSFNFDFKSEEYKRWKASNCHGLMNASGHLDECASCLRSVLDSLSAKIVVTKGKPSLTIPGISQEQLELLLNASQKGAGRP